MTNIENEDIEIEKAITQLVPNHARMTVSEFMNQDKEDDCIDSQPSDSLVASMAEDIRNSIVGNEDSDNETELNEYAVPTEDALKALATVSLLLDHSNPDNKPDVQAILDNPTLGIGNRSTGDMLQVGFDCRNDETT